MKSCAICNKVGLSYAFCPSSLQNSLPEHLLNKHTPEELMDIIAESVFEAAEEEYIPWGKEPFSASSLAATSSGKMADSLLQKGEEEPEGAGTSQPIPSEEGAGQASVLERADCAASLGIAMTPLASCSRESNADLSLPTKGAEPQSLEGQDQCTKAAVMQGKETAVSDLGEGKKSRKYRGKWEVSSLTKGSDLLETSSRSLRSKKIMGEEAPFDVVKSRKKKKKKMPSQEPETGVSFVERTEVDMQPTVLVNNIFSVLHSDSDSEGALETGQGTNAGCFAAGAALEDMDFLNNTQSEGTISNIFQLQVTSCNVNSVKYLHKRTITFGGLLAIASNVYFIQETRITNFYDLDRAKRDWKWGRSRCATLTVYADDITLLVAAENVFNMVLTQFEDYAVVSGSKVNLQKLKVLCINTIYTFFSFSSCPSCLSRLGGCDLTAGCCEDLSSILSTNSSLTLLNLSYNNLEDSGVKCLSAGLRDPNCKLQKLLLEQCGLTASCCEDLSSVLSTNSSLTELNLHRNTLGDSGVKHLSAGLRDPNCKLQTLLLVECGLTAGCCEDLSSVLSTNSSLMELNLTCNNLGDSGVKRLSAGLRDPNCKLQKLVLERCSLTAGCCEDLSSVLSTNSSLTELNLGGNKLGDLGVKRLSAGLRDPNCKLQKLQ
nr:PREDICTED: NACHT, LRR and PYD domains-containing protein 5-like [Latimeria chalumnae]|eukprot:XP_014339495.1 PREDICTED: NACHT, LRR and PYD domains-containing protein 5-like [Latimeria chalumnae]